MSLTLVNFVYLVASVLFILGLKGLTHPRTAVRGNLLGALAMFIAVVVTLLDQRVLTFEYILLGVVIGSLIGAVLAIRIPMTSMPELVAIFNGFGGIASVLVAGAALIETTGNAVSMQFSVSIAASGLGAPLYGLLLDSGFDPRHVWTISPIGFASAAVLALIARPPRRLSRMTAVPA